MLDSSRAGSRKQEVDTGDRNKEGPLVFTQQVKLKVTYSLEEKL